MGGDSEHLYPVTLFVTERTREAAGKQKRSVLKIEAGCFDDKGER